MNHVAEFHHKFNLPAPAFMKGLGDRTRLREALIEEELAEFIDALTSGTPAEIYKEASDLLYVVYGMFVEAGLDSDILHLSFKEVHRSNMSKLGEDGKPVYRADGKVLKGPNYSPADIQSIIEKFEDE